MSDNERDEEYDRFVFHPGDLRRVTDPQQLASIYKKRVYTHMRRKSRIGFPPKRSNDSVPRCSSLPMT